MVHFVGAGPGAAGPHHAARRGAAARARTCVIYAGSLVNPALLGLCQARTARSTTARR